MRKKLNQVYRGFNIRARTLMLLILFTAATRCGLPVIPFLSPPERLTATIVDFEIRFEHPGVSEALSGVFRGYELYYKFYGDIRENDAVVRDIEEQFIDDDDVIQDSPRQPNPNRLTQLDYRRIRRVDQPTRRPVIRIDAGDRQTDLTITLRFPEPEEDDAVFFIDDGDPVALRRGVDDIDDTPKAFFPFGEQNDDGVYAAGDDDFSEELLDRLRDDRIHIAIYGLAYGLTDDFEVIYSVPEFLGRVELRI